MHVGATITRLAHNNNSAPNDFAARTNNANDDNANFSGSHNTTIMATTSTATTHDS